jgi:hypothetical protein
VDLLSDVWRYGAPLLLVLGSVAALTDAIRSRPDRIPIKGLDWPWLGLLVIWTGDAALGEARPPFERIWKAAVTALLWLAVGITLWRRRRHRIAHPVSPAPESTSPRG